MQSGISASKELVAQFNTLLESDRHFGLLATITGEALTPLELLTPSSGAPASEASFASNVDALLVPRLQEKQPLYILLRRYDTSPYLVAATYVPDAAPVRQKMLFASTRLALVRELGSEHFRKQLFVTAAEELTGAGFKKHDAHEALDAPLTEEERELGAVKRAEQEAGRGTATREIHLSSHFKMPLTDGALAALKDLDGGRTLVILKINPDTEIVELDDVSDGRGVSTVDDVVRTVSATEPRFTFFRYTHTHEGAESSPLLFFYTCPASPGTKAIKFRMMYPLMKRAVLGVATGEAGLTLEKKFEVEEASEISEATVLAELHPQVETRKAFSRPKRPGR
ncbi:PTK9 protein tyrosine kinase 9 [Sporothrix schenckii 1099-18]|uniref:PTK9 protein tyrosine kinase 9 n=1 Tax=Sporothrix schenckii 1099-18 TaxID=1397361 RepID=A0A0F2MIY1_SPOSC|nr:PTK9 protein tyrosine kinase 9 [Sporothrix schenckii 1099-18]KJR88131.1 PTK9 protein tyrosine kinase 9 [Sporothrix schenckii 1099-18]